MTKPTSVYVRGHEWSKDAYNHFETEILDAAVAAFNKAVEEHDELKDRGFRWEPYTSEVFAIVDSEKRPFYHDDHTDLLDQIRTDVIDAAYNEYHGL